MWHPEILVVECNKLAPLTVRSIEANMPDWSYKVAPYEGGFIPTALNNSDGLTLVVKSGVMLDIQDGDIPSQSMLKNYDICAARAGVFSDHRAHKNVYRMVGSELTNKHLDLSVFIINRKRWVRTPDSDAGVLPNVKRLRMPRHMNHKSDRLVPKTLSAMTAMYYGMLAEQASVFNYVDVFERGRANGNEMFAYALEKALPFSEGLSDVQKLATRTTKHAAKLRVGLAKCIPIQETGK